LILFQPEIHGSGHSRSGHRLSVVICDHVDTVICAMCPPMFTAHIPAAKQGTVDNKLAMNAVFGKNMEAFPESDDEDESCGSDGDTEDGGSADESDDNGEVDSNN
jgi:hypothetical protein